MLCRIELPPTVGLRGLDSHDTRLHLRVAVGAEEDASARFLTHRCKRAGHAFATHGEPLRTRIANGGSGEPRRSDYRRTLGSFRPPRNQDLLHPPPASGDALTTTRESTDSPSPFHPELGLTVMQARHGRRSRALRPSRAVLLASNRLRGPQLVLPQPVAHGAAVDAEAICHPGDRQALRDESLERRPRDAAARRVLRGVRGLEAMLTNPIADGRTRSAEALANLL